MAKLRRFGAVIAISLCVISLPATARKWCDPNPDYHDALIESIAELRWSLFAASILEDQKTIDSTVALRLVDGAIISLSNTLTIRARYSQACDFDAREYAGLLAENQQYPNLLFAALGAQQSPAMQAIVKSRPALLPFSSARAAIEGQPLDYSQTIRARLKVIFTPAKENPYSVAVWGLQGRPIPVTDAEISKQVRVRSLVLVDSKVKEELNEREHRNLNTLTVIQRLGHYYKMQPDQTLEKIAR